MCAVVPPVCLSSSELAPTLNLSSYVSGGVDGLGLVPVIIGELFTLRKRSRCVLYELCCQLHVYLYVLCIMYYV